MAKILKTDEPKSHLEIFLENEASSIGLKGLEQGMTRTFPHAPDMPRCSTKVVHLLADFGVGFMGPRLDPAVATPYCVAQCAPYNAVWTLEDRTAEALLKTELPFDRFPFFPKLPFRGLYLRLPKGIFQLENDQTGMHDVEGFYLVEDHIWDPKSRTWQEAILVLGTGESRQDIHHPLLGLMRDDAIVFFHLAEHKSFDYVREAPIKGIWELLVVSVNLLWALHTNHLQHTDITPIIPKSPAKRKKRSRRGLTMLPYTVVQLSAPRRSRGRAPTRRTERQRRPCPRPVVVSGHWRSYWVLDPGEEAVLETKSRSGKESTGQLHRVSRWIHPYIVNTEAGDIPQQKSVVRL